MNSSHLQILFSLSLSFSLCFKKENVKHEIKCIWMEGRKRRKDKLKKLNEIDRCDK